MTRSRIVAVAALLLCAQACEVPSSPVGGDEVVHVQGGNEIAANTAVSVYGPEGNASNAAGAALPPAPNGASPDYNVAGLDARHDEERGNLGGRSGER